MALQYEHRSVAQPSKKTYFHVEAQNVGDDDTIRFDQTVFTTQTDLVDQREAIWLHVYRALRPGVGDHLIITFMEEEEAPESADE